MENRAKESKLKEAGSRLYPLIDRLQKCSEAKYPNRKWNNDFYYECAFQWMDKIDELEQRVIEFESDQSTKTPNY